MILSLYFVLGILLLTAVRNPSANRSLIAFTAWSSFAHATVMAILAARDASQRGLLPGVYALIIIGVVLITFAPNPIAGAPSGTESAFPKTESAV